MRHQIEKTETGLGLILGYDHYGYRLNGFSLSLEEAQQLSIDLSVASKDQKSLSLIEASSVACETGLEIRLQDTELEHVSERVHWGYWGLMWVGNDRTVDINSKTLYSPWEVVPNQDTIYAACRLATLRFASQNSKLHMVGRFTDHFTIKQFTEITSIQATDAHKILVTKPYIRETKIEGDDYYQLIATRPIIPVSSY